MSSARELSAETPALTPGTVMVSIELPVAAAAAWEALTEPEVVSQWFGTPSPGWRPGGEARLDFGDGDFFAISNIMLAPPQLIRYNWRFLGTGPLDTVTWRVSPKGDGCTVTVTDSEPFRSPETASMLREGWLDFTSRLAGFLTTGRRTRYDWRRELDGLAELSCPASAAETLLDDDGVQALWLPFGGALAEGLDFTLPDGLLPRRFRLLNLRREGADAVSFQLTSDVWRGPTECRLDVTAHGPNALLGFSHTGWEAITRDPAEQLAQRRRFCDIWVAALERARELVGLGEDGDDADGPRTRDA